MKKLKKQFENIGFIGQGLDKILNAFSLKTDNQAFMRFFTPQYFALKKLFSVKKPLKTIIVIELRKLSQFIVVLTK